MKRNLLKIAVLTLTMVLLFGSVSAYAAGPITNQIKGSDASPSTAAANGRDLLRTASNAQKIEQPLARDYFDTPFFMYINAPAEHSIYTYDYWSTNNENKLGAAYHGSRVTVLAEHDDFYCILYYTENNVLKAAWARAALLVSYYPGLEYVIGSNSTYRNLQNIGDPTVSWSKEYFVGTKRKFTILDSWPDNCVGFTLDYQVTARNGSPSNSVPGPRDLYVNDGTGWIYLGSFDYEDHHSPVHVVVTLPQKMTLAAVATVADCGDPNTFLYRQSVLDVLCAD